MTWTEAQKKYARSEKGKLARKRYQLSEKGREARRRYMLKKQGNSVIELGVEVLS